MGVLSEPLVKTTGTALRRALSAGLAGVAFLVAACGNGGGGGGGDGGGGLTATLSWSASESDSVIGYRVYSGTAQGTYDQAFGSGFNVGNTTSYTVAGLAAGQTYFFAVTAVDAAGRESPYSNEASKLAQ